MYRSNNILALIPPDNSGEKILKQTLFFQKPLGMRIFVLHITEEPNIFQKIFHSKRVHELKEEAWNNQKKFIEKTINDKIPDYLIIRVKSGKKLPVLISQSKKGGYEFMIIDKSQAENGLSRHEIDKIISRSFCPVLAINKDYPVSSIKKIIIPVDISQSTKKKLLWATYFAKKFNAKIEIVSALNVNLSQGRSLAWKNAEQFKYMLFERGVDCEVQILKTRGEGKHKIIIDYIKKENPGLVIIRTHQESNMSGTQIGKFVSEIIHGCNIPVFSVNRFMSPKPVDFEY
ncbi:MAG: universal stress protein [Prolixibacteraceae bacterium]|nr:universal stress protein [Prolixibacteraceae bacterium]